MSAMTARRSCANLDLRIDMDDRIALLGANGNGKSTLVKLLAGRLAPMTGEFRKSSKLKVGYFAQHQAEALDLNLTAVAQAKLWMKDILEEKVRAHLGRFGFPQQKADTQIAKLSGGEKARLLFALMTREAPHILMLDEPTNHLDIDSREALIQAINEYEGAVILISHDPHLIELTADRLLLVDGGACRAFDGDLEDYRKLLLEKRRAERSDRTERESGLSKKDQRRAAAELRAALAPLKRKADDAEKLIAKTDPRASGTGNQDGGPGTLQRPRRQGDQAPERPGRYPEEALRRRGHLDGSPRSPGSGGVGGRPGPRNR